MNAPLPIAGLASLREQIDAVDDELIRLLKHRIGIVEQVGHLKRGNGESGLFIRSGREGAMLKRIFESFRGHAFNAEAAAAIWRLLISASIHHENPISLSVYYTRQEQSLLWLAREYFGAFVPVTPVANAGQALSDLQEGKAAVGVVPFPDEQSNWWLSLSQEQEKAIRIFAHLPAVINEHLPKSVPYGLALGLLTPEPSGDDQSYFRFTLEDTLSTSKFQSVLQEAGVQGTIMQMSQQPHQRSLLVRLDGFIDQDSPVIASVTQSLKHIDCCWLGAHPTPIAA